MGNKNIQDIGAGLQMRRHLNLTVVHRGLLLLFLPVLIASVFFRADPALSVSLTWDGGGADNNWSTCANWSSNICPTSADTVLFNSTSVKNAVVDAGFGGTIVTLTVSSTYTGTISFARSLLLTSNYSQSGGIVTVGANNLTINGTYALSGGIFNAPSSSMSVAGNFTYTAGTFNANNGSVSFVGANATINCGSVVFNFVSISHSSSTKIISSGCSLPLGNNPFIPQAISNNGLLSGSGTLTVNASFTHGTGSNITGFNGLIINGTTTVSGANLNFSSYSVVDINSPFTMNSGSIVAPSGNMSFSSSFTINGGTFNANGGTVLFDGTSGTLSCGNITFAHVVFAHTSSKTVSSNCSIPLGNNPSIGRSIVLNGTLTGSGAMLFGGGTFTLNSTANINGFSGLSGTSLIISGYNLDASSYSPMSIGSFTLNSGSFIAPSSSMSQTGAFTISGGTFNANNGTIVVLSNSGLWSCNNATFSKVVFSHLTGSKAISSDCSLPLGNDAVITGAITLNGTLSGTGSLTTKATTTIRSGGQMSGFSGIVADGSSYIIDGADLDWSTVALVDMNSRLHLLSGSLIAPAGVMNISGELLVEGGTFNANGGVVEFDGETSNNIVCNNITFNLVRFRNTLGSKNVANNCTLPLGDNPVVSSGGNIYSNGIFTGSGIMHANGYLKLQKDAVLTGFSGLKAEKLTIGSANANFSSYTSFEVHDNFEVIKPANFLAPPTMRVSKNVALPDTEGSLQMGAAQYHYASSPDSTALDISGDIDIRVKARPETWTPGYVRTLAGKWDSSTGQRSYRLRLGINGELTLGLSNDGAVTTTVQSTSPTGLADGQTAWVRATWRESDGRGQFFSSTDGVAWSQIGTDVMALSAPLFNSTAKFGIGGLQETPDSQFVGDIYAVQLRNNVLNNGSGIVFDANFTGHTDSTTSFAESSSNAATVSLSGSSTYIAGAGAGTFNAGTGSVVMDGTDQTVSGNITFFDLIKNNSVPSILRFDAGTTTAIQNNLTLIGGPEAPLTLVSSSPGTRWNIKPSGSQNIRSVSVSDSENLGASVLNAYDSSDQGNNLRWSFLTTSDPAPGPSLTSTEQATLPSKPRYGNTSSSNDNDADLDQLNEHIVSDRGVDYTSSANELPDRLVRDDENKTNTKTSLTYYIVMGITGLLSIAICLFLLAKHFQNRSEE